MNLLGIDFEEWYHPKLIQRYLTTQKKNLLITNGIDKILDWLRKNETYATFFIVGEIIESKPEILDKILSDGHEVGFHTMHHNGLESLSYDTFDNELKTFNKLTSGKSVGFRAPTFSLNHSTSWAIDALETNNYSYDSSLIPARSYMYGVSSNELGPYKIKSRNIGRNHEDGKILEFPLLTSDFFIRRIPIAGGFYLRALPIRLLFDAIKKYEKNEIPATMYIHSWELVPELMPKIDLPFKEKFITYHNIKKAFPRIDSILKKFKFTSFTRYIAKAN